MGQLKHGQVLKKILIETKKCLLSKQKRAKMLGILNVSKTVKDKKVVNNGQVTFSSQRKNWASLQTGSLNLPPISCTILELFVNEKTSIF